MAALDGKVAVVTGASRGIGAATAKRLATDGARVVVNYARSADEAAGVLDEIRAAGGEAVTLQADLADPQQIRRLFEEAITAFGRVDILVNNAGALEFGTLDAIDAGQFDRVFAVNVRAVVLASAEAARRMEDGGRIINISSGLGHEPAPGLSVYGASKAALESFTRSHAEELGPRGITVNAVSPGFTDTVMFRSCVQDGNVDRFIALTPMGRLGQPEDIADVIAFLASDQARWVTGQIVGASGGLR